MPKMRVVHLSIGLQWGGAETWMAEVATHLDKARFDVQVVALQGDGPVGEQLRKAGIPVTVLNTAGGLDPRAYLRLQQWLSDQKPDVVHAHLLRPNLLACLTRRNHAVVWHEHGTGEWLNPAVRLLERRLMTRSHAVIAISNKVRDNLITRVPEVASRVIVLPNAIDTSQVRALSTEEKNSLRREAWGLGPEHRVVGFVGRLDDRFKGISYLLKSIAQIKRSLPSIRVVLVGGGDDESMLRSLTQKLGIKDSVVFTGPRADAITLCGGFDVLALPSLSEGFGIVLLEAMANALPVVASRVGGIPEVVQDPETGRLVLPGDVTALAGALEEILKNPDLSQRMGQAGLSRVKSTYDLSNIVPKIERLYSEIRP